MRVATEFLVKGEGIVNPVAKVEKKTYFTVTENWKKTSTNNSLRSRKAV